MLKRIKNLKKPLVGTLTFIIFCQFINVSALAIPVKIKKNTLSLSRSFSKPLSKVRQKEKSELAKKILTGNLIQPHAARELNHSLRSIRNVIAKIEEKIGQGENPAIQIKYLQAKYESLKSLDKKVRNNLSIRQNNQKERKASAPVQERTANLYAHYEKNIDPVLMRLEKILKDRTNAYEDKKLSEIGAKGNFLNSLREFKDYFDANVKIESAKPELAPSPPAFRPSNFKAIKPDTSGKVVPAYILQKASRTIKAAPKAAPQTTPQTLSSDSSTVTQGSVEILSITLPNPEDTQETIDVVITQEMRDLVASMNNSPARIFEWVKNNIEVEFYYGSMKGSRGTLIEKAGNDVDTVSLLLALYRAADVPCRYVTGTIELPIDKAKNLTGVDDPDNLGDLIASAGIPAILITSGTDVVALQMEHTWAEALVDYDPYAGAKAGEGDLWVPLSPWYKPHEYDDGVDLVQMSGFDTNSFLEDFISSVKPESPVDLYKIYFEDYLAANNPGMNWQDGLRTRKIKSGKFRTLPNTLNFTVISVNGEYAELPDGQRHKVTLNVPQVSLSYTLNLSEVVGKKLTYSYPPADAASKSLIDSSGGIENVDPLAVNLRPALKLEGGEIATGSVVNAGYYHTLRTTFSVPGQGSDFVEYSVISGAYYSVGLDPQLVSNKFLVDRIAAYISTVGDTPENTDNMDEITGEALYLAVMKYFNDCNTGDTIFAQSQRDVFLKQTSGAITGKNLVVYTLFGIPSDLEPGGYFVDAKRNIYTPVSVTGDANRELDFMILGGYNASYFEHGLFEEFFNLEAISTVKLLSLANEQGMPVYDIDSSNIGSILPLLGVDSSVKSTIQSAVSVGHVVKIHQDPLAVKNWSGVGYVDRDPSTNAAGYIIGGGWAGGSTVDNGGGDAGGPGAGPTAGDPVNIANGNLFHIEEDFTVPAVGMPITMKRYYNSMVSTNGPFGFGWTHTYNESVVENSVDESLTYTAGDGSIHAYEKNPDGTYKRPAGMFSVLTKDATGFELREKNGTRHVFDTGGKLAQLIDRNGNTTSFTYTGDNLTLITDPASRNFTLVYNASDQIETITAPGGHTWTYTYTAGDLTSATNNAAQTTLYTYYPDHKMATRTNPEGGTVTFNYYSSGKAHVNLLPNGGTFVFSYNAPLRVTSVTDPDGNTTVHYYNTDGLETGHLDPLGYEELYEYDADHNRIKIIDKNGGITTRTYDANGNLLTDTDPLNYTTTYTLESVFNQVVTVADPLGHTVTNTYDANGNLLSTLDSEGLLSEYTYYPNGLRETVTESGQLKTTSIYHADGSLATVVDVLSNTTNFTVDDLGRQTSKTDGNSNTAVWVRDAAGNITTSTDAESRTTFFTYNKLNLRTSMTDAENRTTTYEYNNWGRLTRVVDPMGLEKTYTYSLNYKLATATDKNGQTTTFTNDPLGRVVQRAYASGQAETFVYDPVGNIVQVIEGYNTITRTYDANNRLTSVTDARGKTVDYTYDAVGNRLTMTDPQGGNTQYTYLSNRRLSSITDPEGGLTSFTYLGQHLQKIAYPNGTESVYTRNPIDRVTRVENKVTAGAVISSYDYTYDAVGNRTSVTTGAGTEAYQYDRTYQITRVDYPDGDYNVYTYDNAGNRTSIDATSSVTTYTYDDNDRLLNAGSDTYTYDNNGNRLTATIAGQNTVFSYNSKNKVSKVTYPDGTSDEYTYNYLGQRIKQAGATEQFFVYDDNRLLLEYRQDGIITARYTNGPTTTGPLYKKDAVDERSYFLKDVLGSVTQITDEAGLVQESYTYDVFGAKRSAVVIDDRGVKLAYTGKRLEAKSGLLDFGARYFDPRVGRFISSDSYTWGPDDFRGLENNQLQRVICEVSSQVAQLHNLFAYMMNNPVSDVDNDGFVGYWWDLLIIIASVIVAIMAVLAASSLAVLTATFWGPLLLGIGIALGVAGIISAAIWGGRLDLGLAILAFIAALVGLWLTSFFWTVVLAIIAVALAIWALIIWINAETDSGDDKVAWVPQYENDTPGSQGLPTPWGKWAPVMVT